jgi:hypothetical protein
MATINLNVKQAIRIGEEMPIKEFEQLLAQFTKEDLIEYLIVEYGYIEERNQEDESEEVF